jgi:hypothetical protein
MTLSKEERSASAKRAKNRGGNFQREVAKLFSAWWDREEESFYSTPASGGLRWQKRDDVIGDIVVPPSFEYNIECKSREEIGLGIFFERKFNKTDNIHLWWNQILSDTARSGKKPMLVFKQLRHYPVLCIRIEDFSRIASESPQAVQLFHASVQTSIPCLNGEERVAMLKLTDFLGLVGPADCRKEE